MLERLHNLAVRLAWVQPLAVTVGILALLVAGYLATGQETLTEQYLIPAILLFCWCLLIYTLVGMFITPPPVIEPGMGFFIRQRARFYRLLRTLVALAFLSLTVALALLSYRLISTGIG
jgi:hypothetical protein